MSGHSAEKDVPDTMTLGCPRCPRRPITRRRRRSQYLRVTPWAMGIARYRCEGCGFEHGFTSEWVRNVTSVTSPGEGRA